MSGTSDRDLELPVPAHWLFDEGDQWRSVWPMTMRPRTHGWKIHISTTEDAYRRVLMAVAVACFETEVAFKYITRWQVLRAFGAKDAERASAGKLIVVYPPNDTTLDLLADRLDRDLQGVESPFILGDVRFREGPVYFRYGGFLPLTVTGHGGADIPAMPGVDGVLEPDIRAPLFRDRDVPKPAAVHEAISTYYSGSDDSPLDLYSAIEPIQFSSAGGVYLATARDGERTIIKEARRHAGLDANGNDAFHRINQEWANLERLGPADCAPRPLRRFDIWEHRFIEMEWVDGRSLQVRTAMELPTLQGCPSAMQLRRYARDTVAILTDLRGRIIAAHAVGVAVGDLHPGNVMVLGDGTTRLIDLEDGRSLASEEPGPFHALGFGPPRQLTAEESDWFAFSRVVMSAFDPSFARELLTTGSWERSCSRLDERFSSAPLALIRWAEARFPSSLSLSSRAFGPGADVRVVPAPMASFDSDRIAAGLIHAWQHSSPTQPGRRIPGHPGARGRTGRLSVANGTAGAALALHRSGTAVPSAMLDQLEMSDLIERPALGLFSGLTGISAVLRETGRSPEADRLDRTVRREHRKVRSASLHDGLAGLALGQLLVDPDFAIDVASLLAARSDTDSSGPTAQELHARPGLLHGWAGLAFTFAEVYRITALEQFGTWALAAFDQELMHIVESPGGSAGLADPNGARSFPYLENGAAGMLVALGALGEAGLVPDGHDLWQQLAPRLLAACSGTAYVFDGLFRGAAGVLVGLASVQKWVDEATTIMTSLQDHVCSNAVEWDGTTQFHGDDLLRLSADLATGSSGVLLAGLSDRSRPHLWLPGLLHAPGLQQPRGGEHNGIDPRTPGTRRAR